MNWKMFLKPDWRKVIIFVAVLILASQMKIFCSSTNFTLPPVYNGPSFEPVVFYDCYSLTDIVYSFAPIGAMQFIFLPILLMSAASYLVSCFIIWCYNRYFKRVKK